MLAGLLRIDLPGMKIENRRRVVSSARSSQKPAGHRVGQQTKVAAARGLEIDPQQSDGSQRDFEQPLNRGKGSAGGAGAAIEIMFYRVNTGAVLVSLFGQYKVSPFIAVADREGRSAVSADDHTADILEGPLAATHIGAEGLGRLAIGPQMARAMARELVPARNDAPHQRR